MKSPRFLLVLVASACAVAAIVGVRGVIDDGKAAERVPAQLVRVLTAPATWDVRMLTWIPGEQTTVLGVSPGDDGRFGLYLVGPDDRWRRLAVPAGPNPACIRRRGISPGRNGPRSFAFVAQCFGDLDPRRANDIREYSLRSKTFRRLYPYYVPWLAGGFALDPLSDRGLLNDGYGLAERLRWLLPKRLSAPIKLPLDRVGDPIWSPDGKTVALAGARGLSNVEGVNRLDAAWRLYLLDPRNMKLSATAVMVDPDGRRGAWSPDSRFIAMPVRTGDESGLGLIRVRDQRLIMVRSGTFGDVEWLQMGTVAATRSETGNRPDTVEFLNVGAALRRFG